MNQPSASSGRLFGVFLIPVFLISISVYAATMLPWGGDEKVENGFLVTVGSSKEITVWSECKKVTATTKNVYVPTRTKNEWDQFKLKAGNVGASIANCGASCVPHACDAPNPVCEQTTYGTSDSCGTSCSKYGGTCSCTPNWVDAGACSTTCGNGTRPQVDTNCGGSRDVACTDTSGNSIWGSYGACTGPCGPGNGSQSQSNSCGGINTISCTASECATPINGQCGSWVFTCNAGTLGNTDSIPVESYPRGCFYSWSCDGINGGSSAGCSDRLGCFSSNELVKTPSGEVKISELKIGDTVISYDELKNQFVENTIDRVITHDGIQNQLHNFDQYPLLDLIINTNGVKKKTQVTANHLYYSPASQNYKHIERFNIGDIVQSIDGTGYIVSMTRLSMKPVVYNLHMRNKPNNYLVNGVVVHNEKDEAICAY